jgi:hypothetical protein
MVTGSASAKCMEPRQIRTIVLQILSQLYVAVAPDDVSLCAEVVTGSHLSEKTVAGIARQDLQEFSNGTGRDIWICPALEYPNGSANHEYLTRSDWPIRARIVEGVQSEAQELALLRVLCDMAAVAEGRGGESPALSRLMSRIDDLAIHIPASAIEKARSRRTVPASDIILYREIAEDLYGPIIRAQRKKHEAVVSSIDKRPLPERYFGREQ